MIHNSQTNKTEVTSAKMIPKNTLYKIQSGYIGFND